MSEAHVSVIDPISPAMQRVKLVLFDPFDLSKWFVVGFCAWLANVGRGGVRVPGGPPGSGFGSEPRGLFETHLPVIVALAAVALVVGVAIAVVLLWLSSRGRFMFLRCVALNRAEVKVPWHKYREQGNSVFLFRLGVGVIFFLALLLFGAIIVLSAGVFSTGGFQLNAAAVAGIIIASLVLLPGAIIAALTLKFTRDFVVPIIYLRGGSCVEGWRCFLPLLSDNKGPFALYILFQIIIALAVGVIILVAGLATCCCAFIILCIPYIGTVLMLPILVFLRSYSVYYLRQFGPQFDVFGPQTPPEWSPADSTV